MKKGRKLLSLLLAMITVLTLAVPTVSMAVDLENSPEQVLEDEILSISFDINDRTIHEKTTILEDGTKISVSAEPIESGGIGLNALNGTWRIRGTNGLATMEYYIVLRPSGRYTTISSTYGLAITGFLTSFENERINIVRRTETAGSPAIVEGYARFNYLGNQWISVWSASGGVRASIKNDVITTALY